MPGANFINFAFPRECKYHIQTPIISIIHMIKVDTMAQMKACEIFNRTVTKQLIFCRHILNLSAISPILGDNFYQFFLQLSECGPDNNMYDKFQTQLWTNILNCNTLS